MDKVDLLFEIKKLKKIIELKDSEIRELKSKIKRQVAIEEKLLDEFEIVSHQLANWMPFDDADEIIIKPKCNTV
jgi:ribosomal protein S13